MYCNAAFFVKRDHGGMNIEVTPSNEHTRSCNKHVIEWRMCYKKKLDLGSMRNSSYSLALSENITVA